MKHRGDRTGCREGMVADLMRAYDRHLERVRHVRMPDVYRAVANMPAARFWVTDVRAAQVVSAILRGEDPLSRMTPMRREMFAEIHRRAVRLMERHPALSARQACAIVVMQPAPKFYLTPGTVQVIICRHRKEWVRRKLERLSLWR